jgi:hypothetical protein
MIYRGLDTLRVYCSAIRRQGTKFTSLLELRSRLFREVLYLDLRHWMTIHEPNLVKPNAKRTRLTLYWVYSMCACRHYNYSKGVESAFRRLQEEINKGSSSAQRWEVYSVDQLIYITRYIKES